MKIGIIGLGNMAGAILNGMLQKEMVKKEDIIGSSATTATAERAAKQYGIETTTDNRRVAKAADILILAVKPQFMEEVVSQIRDLVSEELLLITIAAGKSIDWYEEAFGKRIKLVRCMPNTPAMAGEGCTAVCVNEQVTQKEQEQALMLMGSFGKTYMIKESLMDAFSAAAGSSPAFVFMFIEALSDAAVAAGMPRTQAYEAVAQSVLGSAKLMIESKKHPAELKDMVCSPGGTTIRGVKKLEENGMRGALMDAVAACVEWAKQL